MNYAPETASLAEFIYRELDQNLYLNEIYDALLYNYSIKLFNLDRPLKNIPVKDALRFADLLAKSSYKPTEDRDHLWGQEIVTLLRLVYPQNDAVAYYMGSVLSAVGNYRGLKSSAVDSFQSADVLDCIYYEFDKTCHLIPGKEDEYFFPDQKRVYEGLNHKFFSYSGPTSMGKSFVVQTYIRQKISEGIQQNFAILVPTKALINEVRSSLFESLGNMLKDHNYKIVSAIGDIYLQQRHNFIFIMTPERMHHLLIEHSDINIDFLFVDEAHKISERGGRSTYYYKLISQLNRLPKMPAVIFASPNIPNPEIYLRLIPGIQPDQMLQLASKFTPVCQFKFYIDFPSRIAYVHNDHLKKLEQMYRIPSDTTFSRFLQRVGKGKQNVVYCSSRQKVVDLAKEYSDSLLPLNNPRLKKLVTDIRNDIHKDCNLADFIEKGVAYHVGYLPANIRLRIEKSFEAGDIRTIFCTSTLVEGVNLPADNLFITSYRNGSSNMDEIEFRNLVGRVGRIKYNLYGNVFLLRLDSRHTEKRYEELLSSEVPEQKLSIDLPENKAAIPQLVNDLTGGDIEMKSCHEKSKKDFEALRKFGLILIHDYATNETTPLTDAFEEYVSPSQKAAIVRSFPVEKTNDDITLSFDQEVSLRALIEKGVSYPTLMGEKSDVDFTGLVEFLTLLSGVFKWDKYESDTIGKSPNVLTWYAVILLQWIRGNGLRTIIESAIQYKEKHPQTGVWIGNTQMAPQYNSNSKIHKNYIIAETLGVIENVLLFSISNYFRRFSVEYKKYHGVEYFDNDWYEYVEYGTTNALPIFLQRVGFTRDSAKFLEEPANYKKYITVIGGETKVRKSAFSCGNESVEMDIREIQFNMPELFVD